MTVPEVIALLDTFERDLLTMVKRVREIRYELFETLDSADEAVLD